MPIHLPDVALFTGITIAEYYRDIMSGVVVFMEFTTQEVHVDLLNQHALLVLHLSL